MPMREECRHFQSRTYASGEVARFCVLDLAPEAPWKCPENCPSYTRRFADVGWQHGTLIEPALENPPEEISSPEAARLLDEAEDVINRIGKEVAIEVKKEKEKEQSPWWKRIWSR